MAIFKLKERGHHYQEEGIKILNLILSQMKNNKLSTNLISERCGVNKSKVEREPLYLEINRLLDGPSNIEVRKDGRLFIKSLNSFYKGREKTKVGLVDNDGLVFNTFSSLSDCAKFLGVTQPTVKNRLAKNQLFMYNSKPFYIKMVNKDSGSLPSLAMSGEKAPSLPDTPKGGKGESKSLPYPSKNNSEKTSLHAQEASNETKLT